MAETSVHQERGADTVECFRHEGEDCPRCDGTGSGRAGVARAAGSRAAGRARAARPSSGSGTGAARTSRCTAWAATRSSGAGRGRWQLRCSKGWGRDRPHALRRGGAPRVPRCLLRDQGPGGRAHELDGEGIQRWMDYECEALRFGVDPDTPREELAAMVEGSAVEIPRRSTARCTPATSPGGGGEEASPRPGATARRGWRSWPAGAGRGSPPRLWRRPSPR